MALMSNFIPYREEVRRHIASCRSFFERVGDRKVVREIDGCVAGLDNLRYNITIVGSFNRGKSTLLNTLMERSNDDISPIDWQACTSAIVKYVDKNLVTEGDKREMAIIHFNDGRSVSVPHSALRDYVTEAKNPDNRKGVHSVDVYGDFPAWSKAVTIVDSPGQNSVHAHHDTLLCDFLPTTDAIVLVVSADLPVDGGDIALIKMLQELDAKGRKKIFCVMTKIDAVDSDELPKIESLYLETLNKNGISCDKIYAVAALPVFSQIQAEQPSEVVESAKRENGILALEEDLEKFIVAESDQTQVIKKRISVVLQSVIEACSAYGVHTQEILDCHSFDQAKLEKERAELDAKRKELETKLRESLKTFSREWTRTLRRFERKISGKADAVTSSVLDKIGKGGLIGTAFQAFKLRKIVEDSLALELGPILVDMEESFDKIAADLHREYEEELSIFAKRFGGNEVLTTTVAAGGLAGLGVTTAWGISTATGAVQTALTAFGSYQTAAVASSTCGFFAKISSFFMGGGQVATAASTGATAVTAGVSAVMSVGVSLVVMILVQKLLSVGLGKFIEGRVPDLTEKVLEQMEADIFKSLDAYKNTVEQDYSALMQDAIDDIARRLDDLASVSGSFSEDERSKLLSNLDESKVLLEGGNVVLAKLPSLG